MSGITTPGPQLPHEPITEPSGQKIWQEPSGLLAERNLQGKGLSGSGISAGGTTGSALGGIGTGIGE